MADTLLIGAGDLGTQIGLALADAGYEVVAVRRRADRVSASLVGVSGDVLDGLPSQLAAHFPSTSDAAETDGVSREASRKIPASGPRFLVVCLTAGGRAESDYRTTFIDGVGRVLVDIAARGWRPERALFVSSTSVCASSGRIDESVPASPETATARVLLDAERAFLKALPEATQGIVVRPSGIYGPGRTWFLEQVRRGEIGDPARMTHRVHRDDLARAIAHLLTMDAAPDDLYLVTDEAPVEAGEVAAFIAQEMGVTHPASWRPGSADAAPSGTEPSAPESLHALPSAAPGEGRREIRRLSNARLHSTGFEFTYPSFREGYRAVLRGDGVRHGG